MESCLAMCAFEMDGDNSFLDSIMSRFQYISEQIIGSCCILQLETGTIVRVHDFRPILRII